MRRTKEEAAITREHLLNAALVSFSARGYSHTTLDDIARQAGTTRGAIHWHFGNKAELYNTLVREGYARAARTFKDAFTTQDTPLQTLRNLLVRWISYVEEDTHFRAILELTMLKTEIVPENANEMSRGLQEKAQGNRFIEKQYAQLIQQGIASGEVRTDVDPKVAAVAALCVVNGVVSQWLVDPTSFSSSLSEYGQVIVDFYIRGIAAR